MNHNVNPSFFPAKEQAIQLQGAVGNIQAIAASPKSDAMNKTVVICHPHPLQEGTMHNKVVTTLHRTLQQLGLHTVRFNYRGVGESEGSFAEGIGETDDLVAVLDWVKQVRSDDELWLAGFSFGAYVAYRGATVSPYAEQIKQLITVAPPMHYEGFQNLPEPQCPWIVLQGEDDEIVNANTVYSWIEDLQVEPTIIRFPETSHFFHGKLVEMKAKLLQSLK
tara:strand:- start:22927 stop:23589 length:663 start_codon:yes stop_codon:yes gene_type:complete